MSITELSYDKLRFFCDENQFDFESTEDLSSLAEVLGQERAVRSLNFGTAIKSKGFNIYVLGPPGAGKMSIIKEMLNEKAKQLPAPDDWCYIQNFSDQRRPSFLRLPPGKGIELRNDMRHLIDELKIEIPQRLESEEHQNEQNRILQEIRRKSNAEFARLEEKAREKGFSLQREQSGLLIIPVRDGKPLSADQLMQLPEEERRKIEEEGQKLQPEFANAMRTVQTMQREGRKQLEESERNIAMYAVGDMIDELKEKYSSLPDVVSYLDDVQKDIADNVNDFRGRPEGEGHSPFEAMMPRASFDQYDVNVIVDNANAQGAPAILESNPTYGNLMGKTERQAQFGMLTTNFMMIKPGALHRANGGYLVLEAEHLLRNPFSYTALKRSLKDAHIRITDLAEEVSLISTTTLEPAPIPLSVKVVLVGNPLFYYLLQAYDEEFSELFKVQADFDVQMDRTDENVQKYAQFLKTLCEKEEAAHFSKSGVAKMIEYSVQLARDQKKLSTNFAEICDLAREAGFWASQNGNGLITREDIQKAIDEKIYRSNRIEERLQEMIERGSIFISTTGEAIGQVNGLSVLSLGKYMFGKPSRITARTYMGRGGVINVEREVKMSGPIHNKGVMILTGYLNGKYGQDKPVSMSAQIGFEQLYEGVEGDSASSTELYALLSSLSGIPIQQGLAVTGSVNQHGEIQPIGGVTEKIEGFYEVCKAFGLTGEQGVLIPKSNVDNLMLKDEIVEAVKEGKFHIYPVETIDQGISVLTGKEAGERQEDGAYPEGTVNWAVEEQLAKFAEGWKKYEAKEEDKETDEEDEQGEEEPEKS